MPATSPIPISTTPRRRNQNNESEHQQQQQHNQHNQHQQQQQQRPRSGSVADPSSSAFALRKQWEAKLVSLQRGMEHVQHCRAGDACGSSLCHSTRRLMQTYEKHQCPPPAVSTSSGANGNPNANGNGAITNECKVCKLWDFLMTRRTQMAAIAHLRRPLTLNSTRSSGSILPSIASISSCRVAAAGSAAITGSRRSAASVFGRVLVAQKEAHYLSARRRF